MISTAELITILIGLAVCGVAYFKWRFNYWKRKGLTVPFQPSIPFGNFTALLTAKVSFGGQFKQFYDKLKEEGKQHGGVYMMVQPAYVPVDPEIVKHILQTDFQYFVNHGMYLNEKDDPLSAHLIAQEDQTWKNWRVRLTPTFTAAKMRMMFDTMLDTTPGLVMAMDESAKNDVPLEIKELFARFTTDVIGSCAFGIECNSLKNPDSKFRYYGKLSIEEFTFMENIKLFSQFVLPHSVLRFFNIKITKKSVEDFFLKIVKDTVMYREKNNVYRKDFMHLLLQLRNRGKLANDENIKDSGESKALLTINEVAAQCYIFFIAGFETSSTASTFALYELAKNQKIQQRVRDEVNEVLDKHNGKMTYEAIMEMSYLDKVINESLRMYPPIPVLFRMCKKTYNVPGTGAIIEKGTRVMIPIMGIQRDPEYYPNPDVFDPERFNDEVMNSRRPFTWLPFGEGPRICIGLRFGMLQSKIGIATLLRNHKLTLNEKTSEPIKFKASGPITAPEGGIWLDVEKLE